MMARTVAAAGAKPQWYAYFLSVPLGLLALGLVVGLVGREPLHLSEVPRALLFLVIIAISQFVVLHFDVRRHAVSVTIGEIPLLLALFYLSPTMVVIVRAVACLIVQLIQRQSTPKIVFNVASISVATTVAALVVTRFPSESVTPVTWLVLAFAVTMSSIVSLVAVVGVIYLVQRTPLRGETWRASASVLVVAAANILVGLIVLQVLEHEPWSIVLLLGLAALLVGVYRSYDQFRRQHRSLTELYELTQQLSDAGRNGTLADVLLGRVRELLQAECATLWLPADGRYPQILLTARVDVQGLLDQSPTPPMLRERAVADATTLVVGPKVGESGLRALLRGSGIKDAIVVPLRSGSAVIGSLEVVSRLGDRSFFGKQDVRVLQTLAAHAAVAVENSRLVDRLRFDAYHDALTRLPNRRRVLAQLEEAVRVRTSGEVVAVLSFDVDGLREVNDAFGHNAGDEVVREVASRLRSLAPSAALVGRTGSDEFLVTLRLPDAAAAQELAAQLRDALQEPMRVGETSVEVSAAVGIAVHPDHADEPEELVRRAVLAAQEAKRFTNQVHVYHAGLLARSTLRLDLAADLRRALDEGEVGVYFQPKVSLPDRRVVGVECLARWDHPAHGTVPPRDFIAVAEHTGQVSRITDLVLREGLRRAKGWLDAGRELPVAVNLPFRTVIDPTFPSHVAKLLDESGVPARLITLEIREASMVGEPERSLANLRRLADLGVRLAVDDFGTGYASLSYLRQLPFHEVKIDRSFVTGMAVDADDLATVRAVVGLARHLGLACVAEGVESERTVALLEELGCRTGQGFLFSRALPIERFEAWLAAQEPASAAPAPMVEQRTQPGSESEPPAGRWLRVVPDA